MYKMLDAQNRISTSSFQLYDLGNGKTAVTLNNFAKLLTLEEDDRDDIWMCPVVRGLWLGVASCRV